MYKAKSYGPDTGIIRIQPIKSQILSKNLADHIKTFATQIIPRDPQTSRLEKQYLRKHDS